MELDEIKSLWKEYDSKLERSLRLNLKCLESIQSSKIKSTLQPLFWWRLVEAIFYFIVILMLQQFLIKNYTKAQYVIPAISLILFFIISFANCVKQMILLRKINYSDDILKIQAKLSKLQSLIVDYVRLAFLAIPTYLAYPIIGFKALGNLDITQFNTLWWIVNLIFTLLLIPVCIWFYNQISSRNIHKKWIRFLIEQFSNSAVTKAMEFTKEMEEIKR